MSRSQIPFDWRPYTDKLKNFPLAGPCRIMEVCGTHTMEFFRSGIKHLFPRGLSLVDGPGCPVCVTANDFLDRAIAIGKQHQAIIATFGDLIKVPSSYSSLQKEKAGGMDIRVVYSPQDALGLAREFPQRQVVFLSVGFETTIPTEAVVVQQAHRLGIENFSLLVANKLTPPAVAALLASKEILIDGFILPGHVSTITGVKGWRFVAEQFKKPCVIAGFEPRDLLAGTLTLLDQISRKEKTIINEYTRVVTEEGNRKAQDLMVQIFAVCPAEWRGIGMIPASGLRLQAGFADFDAEKRFPVEMRPVIEPEGCCCGEVLRGAILPPECPLFGRACTPEQPVGACMVSSEGSCAAYYKYQGVTP